MVKKNDVAVPEEEVAPEEASQDAEVTPDGQKVQSEEPASPQAEEESSGDAALEPEAPADPSESSDEPESKADGSEVEDGGESSDEDVSDISSEEKEMPESADDSPEGESGDAEILSQDDLDAAMQEESGSEDADVLTQESEIPVKQAEFQQLSSSAGGDASRNIDLLMDVDLPISIELGRTKLNIADILALAPGSVVELEKLVGEPVDLLVNHKCVARGEVVVVEENFGLRITELVSAEERIKNLQ
jgi:flagellar motor switch protein FliN/FliY